MQAIQHQILGDDQVPLILVVDDEPLNVEMLTSYLEAEGVVTVN